MHPASAPAVRLMKKRVLSRPGVNRLAQSIVTAHHGHEVNWTEHGETGMRSSLLPAAPVPSNGLHLRTRKEMPGNKLGEENGFPVPGIDIIFGQSWRSRYPSFFPSFTL